MNQIIDELTNKLSKSEDKCLQREEEMNIKYHSVMKQLSELEQSSSSNKEKKNRDIGNLIFLLIIFALILLTII